MVQLAWLQMGIWSRRLTKEILFSKPFLYVENIHQFSIESWDLNWKQKLVIHFVFEVILLYFFPF